MTVRLAILISGSGRTLQNFIDRTRDGRLDGKIVCVVSSDRAALGLQRAQEAGIPTGISARSERITDLIMPHRPDLVLLAGFLHLYLFPSEFEKRVVNIHPALLPKFGGKGMYGLRVHRAVLEAGEKESGCTVHFCDREYDHGPIILQRRVPVLPSDTPETLAGRVFAAELEAYPEAVELFAAGRVK